MEITKRASFLSLFASALIMGVKFFAYEVTHSAAIYSDALESIINVLAAGVALFVLRVVAEPADDEHPYGHGKLEYFSAAFEGGLIALAGIMIAREALVALQEGATPRNIDMGLLVSVGAAVANLGLGLYLRHIGKKHRSAALVASGEHVMSDVWSTGGAVIGLLLVRVTGISVFDPVAAFLIAAQLSFSGIKIVRRSVGGLMDEVEPEALTEIANVFQNNRVPAIIDVHLVKVIRSGKFHHIDGHLVLPSFMTVEQAHEVAESFEKQVVEEYSYDGEIAFHIDPCHMDYCSICEMKDCPIRLRAFEARREFSAQSMVRRPLRDQQ